MYIQKCKDLTNLLKDDTCGQFKLDHFHIGEDDYLTMYRYGISPGDYVRLSRGLDVIMSNTHMEICTNFKFMSSAHGKVLVGGLGLGMIILAIQDKEEVTKITVVEKHQEVIDMIEPQLSFNDKVEIIQGDVFEYTPEEKYNTIYLDIWPGINKEIYEYEMKPLIRRYRKYLVSKSEDENRFIDCWAKLNAKNGTPLV